MDKMYIEEGEKFRIEDENDEDTDGIRCDLDNQNLDYDAERETWGGQFECVLSLIGYTVGLGNIWRFPFYCYRNGGGTAILPFLLFLVLCGGPLYYMELCLGQFSGKSPIRVWSVCPLFQGIGLVMIACSVLYIWYIGLAFGWVFYVLIQSFYPTLPWSKCGQSWNTQYCIDSTTNVTEKLLNISVFDGSKPSVLKTAAAEFWEDFMIKLWEGAANNKEPGQTARTCRLAWLFTGCKAFSIPAPLFKRHNVLSKSSGIEDMGSLQLHLVGCLFLGWFVVFLCLAKGVKTLGKVVYVTATLPYVLLTVLLIRGVTLDGAWIGLRHYFIPDFSKLRSGQLWTEAAVQCFYSLGQAWGGLITMASFNKFHHNALRDTLIVCFADVFTAIYGGVIVFSVLGFLSKSTGTPLDEMPLAGVGLAFIAYPEALSRLPAPNVWSVLFFLTLALMGIDSQFGTFEVVSNAIVDLNYKRLRRYRVWITAFIVLFLFLAGLPITSSGGIYIFVLVDWNLATFNITVIALLEVIVLAWIYGADRFSSDIEMMRGSRPSVLIRLLWCFVIPAFIMGILITTMLTFTASPVEYKYPPFANVIGYIFAFGPLSLILWVAVYKLIRSKGTIYKRICGLLEPSSSWIPNDPKRRSSYRLNPYIYACGAKERFITNIIGIRHKD